MTSIKGPRIAVVGATGLVGRILLQTMEKRRFPVGALMPFSSGRSRAAVNFRGRRITAPKVTTRALFSADLVFLVSSDDVAKRYGTSLAKSGIWTIDDSSAFRLRPEVPLVIPEINAETLSIKKRLIAGPNCTVTGVALAGYPIHRRFEVRVVHLASYQSVSGAGKSALLEFYHQVRAACRNIKSNTVLFKPPRFKAAALPNPIAFNLFPQVGAFDGAGNCSEEVKVREELRKLWSAPKLRVSSTTVRVPVVRGHSLAVWMETKRRLNPAKAKTLLQNAQGVELWKNGCYPTVADAGETEPIHVGRVRSGASANELAFWVVSDNLLKGAALNSIHIAEYLLKRGWLRR